MTASCDGADGYLLAVVPSSCYGGFDFTLFFEQAVLVIPSCVLILLSCLVYCRRLSRKELIVSKDALYTAKLVNASIYVSLQLTFLVLSSLPPTPRTSLSIPSAVLSFTAALAIIPLSCYEHTRSRQPSSVLGIFLFFTFLFDATITRSLWLRGRSLSLCSVFTVGVGTKFIQLVLEAQKKSLVTGLEKNCLEEVSGIYARSFFWWLNPLFLKGLRNILSLRDLDDVSSDMLSERLGTKMMESWNTSNKSNKWAISMAIWSALKRPLLLPVVPRLALMGFNYSQPFLIKAAISYIQTPVEERPKNHGYGLVGATAIIYLGISISNGWYNYLLHRVITMIRSSLVSVIYQRTLCLSCDSAKSSAALTLMSTDVDRIALTAQKAFDLWACPIEIAVAVFLMAREVGWACVAPTLLALVCTAGSSTIARFMPAYLKAWNQAIQTRVASTAGVIRNMRSVKMMGLGPSTGKRLQDARVSELEKSVKFRWFIAIMNLLGAVPKEISAPLVFLIFLYSTKYKSEEGLSATRAFTTLSLLELLTGPLTNLLTAIPSFTASFGCMNRIQDYLLRDGQVEFRRQARFPARHPVAEGGVRVPPDGAGFGKPGSPVQARRSPTISFTDVTIRYGDDTAAPIIRNLSLSIEKGSLFMLVGPVGSGKTTILRSIIGDLEPTSGTLYLADTDVAYCQQAPPWLVNATVRDNIIGPYGYDSKWYDTVKSCCALDEDVSTFPNRDETLVGSAGLALSGGQKQRLALARAVYARKKVIVLDDVLSALDSHTEKRVFAALFSRTGLLRQNGTTVVMATNTPYHLHSADQIVVLDREGPTLQGTLDDLKEVPGFFQTILKRTCGEDDQIDAPRSTPSLGREEAQVQSDKQRSEPNQGPNQENTDRKTGDWACYSFYFKSMGIWRAAASVGIATVFAFCSKFSQVWLHWYTDDRDIEIGPFIGFYFAFGLSALAFSLLSFYWMMLIILPVSSTAMHQQLLDSVFRAPLSFFTTTDSGVIINRFSQDMAYIAGILPVCSMRVITTILLCITQLALISFGSGYFAAIIPFLIFCTWALQKVYLCTSRQLRHLDLEQKSPLYTALTETIEGLATVRAFGWCRAFESKFNERLDDSQRPVYLLYCIQRWLNLVLDLLVAGLAVVLVSFATQFQGGGSTSGAALGVAMVNILGFSQNLAQFIFFYTELETSLAAVARVKEYVTGLASEDDGSNERVEPPADWPSAGAVRIENITVGYCNDGPPVLDGFSLEVAPGQKVGIAGRTGSGKSTLFLTLLRVLSLRSGRILIDGIDISRIPLQTLRSRITTIPQDPFFPPHASIRENLSGDASHINDVELASALEAVGLMEHITATISSANKVKSAGNGGSSGLTEENTPRQLDSQTLSGILSAKMELLTLSAGQLQFFCLARTLLQDSKLVLLDEVTSAVDHATEEKLREVLLRGKKSAIEVLEEGVTSSSARLRGRTVIMIAHRAEMLAECDVVVHLPSRTET